MLNGECDMWCEKHAYRKIFILNYRFKCQYHQNFAAPDRVLLADSLQMLLNSGAHVFAAIGLSQEHLMLWVTTTLMKLRKRVE